MTSWEEFDFDGLFGDVGGSKDFSISYIEILRVSFPIFLWKDIWVKNTDSCTSVKESYYLDGLGERGWIYLDGC